MGRLIRLVFIGGRFYLRSGTWMSSLYEEETWTRYDWGRVPIALAEGETIIIRPATTSEMDHAEAMLAGA